MIFGRKKEVYDVDFYKFTPTLMSKSTLNEVSVKRHHVISAEKKIQAAISGNLGTHVLIIGPRGMGKTHTLLQIYHNMRKKSNILPVKLCEEEYSVASIEDLFSRILKEIHVKFSKTNVLEEGLEYFSKLKKDGQFPVIIVDNLQVLFEQIRRDLPRLRSVLQERNPFCIVGSAPTVFDGISLYEEPFYNFMDLMFLPGLNDEKTSLLIKKHLEQEDKPHLYEYLSNPRYIKIIRMITGGNPRLLHIICEILINKGPAGFPEFIPELLDQMTPYYQSEIKSLSQAQRKVVYGLSQAQGPSSPTDLSKEINSNVNGVVTQLRRLEKDGIVEAVKFRKKKETLYQVAENLFRMWLEMRSPVGTRRIALFASFLKGHYSEMQLAGGKSLSRELGLAQDGGSLMSTRITQKTDAQAGSAIHHDVYELARCKKYDACLAVLGRLGESNDDIGRYFEPLHIAIKYIKTADMDLLERLHKERRMVALDIIATLEPGLKMPQPILDSVK